MKATYRADDEILELVADKEGLHRWRRGVFEDTHRDASIWTVSERFSRYSSPIAPWQECVILLTAEIEKSRHERG